MSSIYHLLLLLLLSHFSLRLTLEEAKLDIHFLHSGFFPLVDQEVVCKAERRRLFKGFSELCSWLFFCFVALLKRMTFQKRSEHLQWFPVLSSHRRISYEAESVMLQLPVTAHSLCFQSDAEVGWKLRSWANLKFSLFSSRADPHLHNHMHSRPVPVINADLCAARCFEDELLTQPLSKLTWLHLHLRWDWRRLCSPPTSKTPHRQT